MAWLRRVALLTAVFAVLLSRRTAGNLLQCFCSDCVQDKFCYGQMCTAQMYYNIETGQTSERWRCLNDSHLELCDRTQEFLPITISYACCNSENFCNEDIHASLPETNISRNSTIADNSTTSMNESDTVNITQATPTNATSASVPETVPIIVPLSTFFECYNAESSHPNLLTYIDVSFCQTTTSCYNSLRVRRDGSRLYKWGCTRGAQTCEEVNRNRKKKTCCRGWFCNRNISPEWYDNVVADPTPTTPTPTTHPVNSTRPPPANISTGVPPIEEATPNCTVAEDDSLVLLPCIRPGPGSIEPPQLDPPDVALERRYLCYCSNCGTHHICQSSYGCGRQYAFIVGGLSIIQFCMDEATNASCGTASALVCCFTDLCNNLPSLTTTNSISLNDTRGTEPITMPTTTSPTDIDIETSSELSSNDDSAVNSSTPTINNPSETGSESKQEKESFLFYALSILLGLLVLSLTIAMLVMCFCCCGYHKRLHNKPKSSRRPLQVMVGTHEHESTIRRVESHGTAASRVLGERTTSSERVAETSKGCSTGSTCTQTSTPESTV